MKKRIYLFIAIFCSLFIFGKVDASSIVYNVNIDRDFECHEDIIYTISSNEISNGDNYDFLTSVVKDDIYFDNDASVKYRKTKNYSNGVYTVHLKNDYLYTFFTNSRIANECFSDFNLTPSLKKFKVKTSSPFYCNLRADKITINIITDLNVVSSNASSVTGNKYTWNVKDENFNIRFTLDTPLSNQEQEEESIDIINEDELDSDDPLLTEKENKESSNKQQETKKESNSIITIAIISSVLIALITVIVILKAKKSNLNKI